MSTKNKVMKKIFCLVVSIVFVNNIQCQSKNKLPLEPSRYLEIDTDEGTWMSLDVHPAGNKIVFDLLGDIYEIPFKGGKASRITQG